MTKRRFDEGMFITTIIGESSTPLTIDGGTAYLPVRLTYTHDTVGVLGKPLAHWYTMHAVRLHTL
jgi:hypothetical protein